ncbi:substrate-binding and VWA domain-containing protein [Streptosporangium sp. NBC_01755]|uniref:substrate-binding and VWA domain-containing protein n=1 Tax=unclassified Streptosporangium TaxID=2632669 RepID=UPI002DD9DF6C|nr:MULTISPECIES: substrate-binding and VWA domain-containing protein [unclassified Streptosporangium]WSA24025.1 substrate-binding and VWA domain-containing protein [Streptosporangium sp. NBC_01810]WSC97903.1 substrate-binding and VWA domain-containing protein [Streptosporangium sp. NBC_01755]
MVYPPARPRRRVLPYLLAVVLAIALIAGLRWYFSGGPGDEPNEPGACSGESTQIRVASSQDKIWILREVAKEYSGRTVAGRCADVVIDEANSGTAMRALAKGWDEKTDGRRPDVWSPAASAWVTLLRQQASSTDGTVPVADGKPSPIVTAPLVFAMPKPMAQALGWPGKAIGWSELAGLAADPRGWAKYGHPEWGRFKLGKTNPNFSTSGLNATIGAYFAATGTTSDLTARDVADAKTRNFVQGVEQSIVHYGDISMTFLGNLLRADDRGESMAYISAITVEENSVTDYNRGNPSGNPATLGRHAPPRTPLVAVNPKEGTLYSDHPYVPLTWMDAAKKAVADDFLTYLHSPEAQARFQSYGYRSFEGKPGPQATEQNGVIPDAKITTLSPPTPAVLDRVLRSWSELRKRANVLIVVDKSGSMEEEAAGTGETRLELAKKAAINALPQFRGDDKVGLWAFSTAQDGEKDYLELVPIDRVSKIGDSLRDQLNGLAAGGGTGLYDTTLAAVERMRGAKDEGAINAVVFLTDGKNEKNGGSDLDNLLGRLTPDVRLFTIGYGEGADQGVLKQIAEATDGAAYDSSRADTIDQVFTSVISNF